MFGFTLGNVAEIDSYAWTRFRFRASSNWDRRMKTRFAQRGRDIRSASENSSARAAGMAARIPISITVHATDIAQPCPR